MSLFGKIPAFEQNINKILDAMETSLSLARSAMIHPRHHQNLT